MPLLGSDEPRQGELLPGSQPPAPPQPFAGFLPRLFALVIDGIAIYALCGLAMQGGRSTLLALNPWLPYIGLVLGFLYFWLADGPVGRGRTLGKGVLGMHTVDGDGVSIGLWPAFKRNALKFLAIYGIMNLPIPPIYAVRPFYFVLAWPPSLRFAGLLTLIVVGFGGATLALIEAISIGLHPYKRAWHDLLARTYVTKDPTPTVFREVLATAPNPLVERRIARHMFMTVPFWLITLVILMIGPVADFTRGDIRTLIQDANTLSSEVLASSNLEATQLIYPDANTRQSFRSAVANTRERAAQEKQGTIPTTDTLRQLWGNDGESIVIAVYQRHGSFGQNETENPDFRRQMEQLREKVWPMWRRYRGEWIKNAKTEIPEARHIIIVIQEQAQLLLYGSHNVPAEVTGPADPKAGELNYIVDPASRLTQPTSPTLPNAAAATTPTLARPLAINSTTTQPATAP